MSIGFSTGFAIARTYRAPEMRDAYRDEIRRSGWPLTELEEQAIEPVDRAFRVDMVACKSMRAHGPDGSTSR